MFKTIRKIPPQKGFLMANEYWFWDYGKMYPTFQKGGNAAQFAIPYAKKVCKGKGLDVGPNKLYWAFPNAEVIDNGTNNQSAFESSYEKGSIKDEMFDFVFSSHCLEHMDDYVKSMEIMQAILKPGGVLFLYLPAYSQRYWRPWNNRKHKHVLTRKIIVDLMLHLDYDPVFYSGKDLNDSFMVYGYKNLT